MHSVPVLQPLANTFGSNWVNPLLGKKRKYVIHREVQGVNLQWKSVGLNEKFPVLCEDCNGKWGSQLETLMKNVSSGMVQSGESTLLSLRDIATIVVYSQLKAFVCDYGQEGVESFYDLGTRRAFRKDLSLPPSTSVWLARTGDYFGVFKSAYAKTPHNTPKRFESYIFTMTLGQFAIQLTSLRWTKKSNRKYASPPLFRQGGEWDFFSIPVWPNDPRAPIKIPVRWPPAHELSRQLLDGFFNRWHTVNRTDV